MKSLEDIFPSIPFTMFFLFFCDGTGQGFPPRRWQEKTPPMTHTGTHTLLNRAQNTAFKGRSCQPGLRMCFVS